MSNEAFTGAPISPEQYRGFLDTLTLVDLFGYYSHDPEDDREECEESMRRMNHFRIRDGNPALSSEEISAFVQKQIDREYAEIQTREAHPKTLRGVSEQLTHWFPYHAERERLASFLNALGKDEEELVVADVGCGSGFVAKLLGTLPRVKVIGIDPNLDGMGATHLPDLATVAVQPVDVWDTIGNLGATYSLEHVTERQALLDKIREETADEPVYHFFYHDFFTGEGGKFNPEVARLQELAPLAQDNSAVDVAMSVFMPFNQDLTIPIRDGLYPKAIIYVRGKGSRTGAGDYYGKDHGDNEDDIFNDDTLMSFHPGTNYRTVARWATPTDSDWDSFGCSMRDGRFLDGEVVIQVRNDVELPPQLPVSVPAFQFDRLLEEQMDPEAFKKFITGISQTG